MAITNVIKDMKKKTIIYGVITHTGSQFQINITRPVVTFTIILIET